jgi:hypothetical protein
MGCPTSISSGVLTPGTATLFNGRQTLNGVVIQPGATVTIYDNGSTAAGTILFLFVNAGTNTETVVFYNAIRAENGLTVVTAAANSIVYFGA